MKSAAHQGEDKLLELAYGELSAREAETVEAHVRGCSRCADALSEIRGVRAAMAGLPMEPPPAAGLDSLLAYAEQAAGRSAAAGRPGARWRRLLMPLASLAALATVGVVSFRANQEFDTSPAAVVADERIEARRAEQVMQGRPDVEGLKAEKALAAKDALPAAPRAEGEAARLQENEALGQAKEAPAEKKKSAPLQSITRSKAQVAKLDALDDVAGAADFSNASGRGAQQAAPSPAPADKGLAFGLGSGAAVGSLGGGAAKPAAPALRADEARARAEPIAEVLAPPPAAAAPPPSPKKGSYGLRPMTGASSVSAGDEEDAALQQVDAMGLDRDAKYTERERSVSRGRALEAARAAAGRGDRAGEIRAASEVLASGAAGAERAEALKRLCDAWEALGEAGRADAFCDQLLAEFPNSTAARAVASRRGNVQAVEPAKRKAADTAPAEAAPARR